MLWELIIALIFLFVDYFHHFQLRMNMKIREFRPKVKNSNADELRVELNFIFYKILDLNSLRYG